MLLGCFLRLGGFKRRLSITFALMAKVSPAGKQVRGHAAETRLAQWLPCTTTEEQLWLWLRYRTSAVLSPATELERFVAAGLCFGHVETLN